MRAQAKTQGLLSVTCDSSSVLKAILANSGNPQLLDGAILAEIGIGDFALATEVARLRKALDGEVSQLAELALFADEAKREDYAALLAGAEGGRDLGDLANSLVVAWAKVGAGKMSEALDDFDALTKKKGFEAFGYYHKALALASVGDFEGADAILSGKAAGLEWATVRALILLRLGQNRVASPADIESARVNFARLMPSTAERVVGFWKTRPAA